MSGSILPIGRSPSPIWTSPSAFRRRLRSQYLRLPATSWHAASTCRLCRAQSARSFASGYSTVDTGIVFDYGVFTPRCRWKDIADIKHLDLNIDVRQAHLKGDRLFPCWNGVMERLRHALSLVQ